LTRPSSTFVAKLLSAAAFALATGCALFQNLDSSPYQEVEAGVLCSEAGGGNGNDAGSCGLLQVTCDPQCDTDAVCCVVPTAAGVLNGTCTSVSACGGPGVLAFALCRQGSDCTDGGACIAQACNGVAVHACVLVPGCKPL
jgi:hypothetical protein